MNTTRKAIFISSLNAAIGLMMFGFGVHLTIQANLGAQPWDTLFLGIAGLTGIKYGNISVMLSVVLILIDIFVLHEQIGLGTILDAFIVGKTVDLFNRLGWIPTMNGSPVIRILILIVGFFIEGFSQYFYMKAALSCGPRDTLQIGLGRLMNRIPIGVVNIFIQAAVLILGWLLGGPVGICSIIAPFGIGLMQQLAFNMMRFDPKTVVHQNLFESIRVLFGKTKAT